MGWMSGIEVREPYPRPSRSTNSELTKRFGVAFVLSEYSGVLVSPRAIRGDGRHQSGNPRELLHRIASKEKKESKPGWGTETEITHR